MSFEAYVLAYKFDQEHLNHIFKYIDINYKSYMNYTLKKELLKHKIHYINEFLKTISSQNKLDFIKENCKIFNVKDYKIILKYYNIDTFKNLDNNTINTFLNETFKGGSPTLNLSRNNKYFDTFKDDLKDIEKVNFNSTSQNKQTLDNNTNNKLNFNIYETIINNIKSNEMLNEIILNHIEENDIYDKLTNEIIKQLPEEIKRTIIYTILFNNSFIINEIMKNKIEYQTLIDNFKQQNITRLNEISELNDDFNNKSNTIIKMIYLYIELLYYKKIEPIQLNIDVINKLSQQCNTDNIDVINNIKIIIDEFKNNINELNNETFKIENSRIIENDDYKYLEDFNYNISENNMYCDIYVIEIILRFCKIYNDDIIDNIIDNIITFLESNNISYVYN